VLKRICEPIRKEVAGGWRRMLNEEFSNEHSTKYYLSNQIKEDEMGGKCSMHGRYEKYIQDFGQKA
jgi:hypothetical protein